MHSEMETLVVECADGIADNLVRQFEDSFFDQAVGFGQVCARIVAGHTQGGLRLEVQNNAALDIAAKSNHAGHTFAAIGILFHREMAHLRGARQTLRQHGVGRVDERLNQFHLHCDQTPAPAEVATAPSSPNTYLITSYSTSGLTGFCTK